MDFSMDFATKGGQRRTNATGSALCQCLRRPEKEKGEKHRQKPGNFYGFHVFFSFFFFGGCIYFLELFSEYHLLEESNMLILGFVSGNVTNSLWRGIFLGELQYFPKQVYLWGSILEKKWLDTLVGALGRVGHGFGSAGRAELCWGVGFGRAGCPALGWALVGELGWVEQGCCECILI